jgi:hypothetical protein
MGDDRIEELFGKLKKLDPATFRHFKEICAMTAFDYNPLDDPDITTPVYGWCLVGVILDAILNNKRMQLCMSAPHNFRGIGLGDKAFEVRITISDGTYNGCLFPKKVYGGGAITEALLTAFVAALEAEATR